MSEIRMKLACLLTHKVSFVVSIYRGMIKWFGAHYNQEVRLRSAVKCKKRPRCLIKDEIIIIIVVKVTKNSEARTLKG